MPTLFQRYPWRALRGSVEAPKHMNSVCSLWALSIMDWSRLECPLLLEQLVPPTGLPHLTVGRTIRLALISGTFNEINTSGCFKRSGSPLAGSSGLLAGRSVVGGY